MPMALFSNFNEWFDGVDLTLDPTQLSLITTTKVEVEISTSTFSNYSCTSLDVLFIYIKQEKMWKAMSKGFSEINRISSSFLNGIAPVIGYLISLDLTIMRQTNHLRRTKMTSQSNSENLFDADLKRKLAREANEQKIYRTKLLLSWFVLLLLLVFVFSGLEINLGFTTVNLIKLDTDFMKKYIPFIAQGAVQTILISIASISLAMILALSSALARLSKSPMAVAISTFYVSLVRGTPLYLQVIFIFLALPQMGIYFSGFSAGVIALGLNYGAYMSEIFRAGILSVGTGQHEAATALGMNSGQKFRFIVMPQALRLAIPPIGNEFIAMLKDSALVSITGFVREILWRSQKVGRANFRNLEALLIAAMFYWMLTLVFTVVQTRIEARFGESDRDIKTITH